MDLNKFTQKSQQAISEAQAVAVRMGQQQVDAEHLLYALLTQEQGLVPRILDKAGYNAEAYLAELERALGKLPRVSGPPRPLGERVGVRGDNNAAKRKGPRHRWRGPEPSGCKPCLTPQGQITFCFFKARHRPDSES